MFFSDLSKNYQLYKKIIDTVLFALKSWSFTYAYVHTLMQYLSSVHAIVKQLGSTILIYIKQSQADLLLHTLKYHHQSKSFMLFVKISQLRKETDRITLSNIEITCIVYQTAFRTRKRHRWFHLLYTQKYCYNVVIRVKTRTKKEE